MNVKQTILIHRAKPFCLSLDRRWREIKEDFGIIAEYEHPKKAYRIKTKKAELKKILKGMAA